jgi:hypothetical protein
MEPGRRLGDVAPAGPRSRSRTPRPAWLSAGSCRP